MPDILTTSEAARMLGCSPRTVQRVIEDVECYCGPNPYRSEGDEK